MDIQKNKPIFIIVLVVILVVVGILFWKSDLVKAPAVDQDIPEPPKEETLSFEGKIYSTPEGARFDDYFVASDGQEYGIEGEGAMLEKDIEGFRDSGKTLIIEGKLLTDVIDYGGREILITKI